MLQGECARVLEAKTVGEFQSVIVAFARSLEFETVSATAVTDQRDAEPHFVSVHNTPAGYLDSFLDRDHGKADPVAQHCKCSYLPIVWNQSTYVRAGCPDFWERQAEFGYRVGISVAIHMPEGRHFLVGIDRDLPWVWSATKLESVLGALQLFTVCAFEAAKQLLNDELNVGESSVLTARELEVLRWSSIGKTAWEIGQILSISHNTVNRHIANASAKLECCGKTQAVVRAARLGLL